MTLLKPTVEALGKRATLLQIEGADHAFHVPVKSGRNGVKILAELLDALLAWATALEHPIPARPGPSA